MRKPARAAECATIPFAMAIKLAFGTAGVRARVGPLDDQLNPRTLSALAHVLLEYAAELAPQARTQGLCIGFDGRRDSADFAALLCTIARDHGFLVRRFELPIPTPVLAFASQRHNTALGLMVTASHNPPEDNGLKVYWQGGSQILSPHDTEIARRLSCFDDVSRARQPARAQGELLSLGPSESGAYLDAVLALAQADLQRPAPRFVYSALCGVGGATTRELLQRTEVPWVEVAHQAEPRADFGGLRSPNPEHAEALEALRALAGEQGVSLAACHDPDADRLAVLIRDQRGALIALTGDEIGALLLDYVLSRTPEPDHCLVVSTWVSGSLAERVAKARGASFERTLTGFKWIASTGRRLARERSLRFVFGYEEALGFCFADMADDKDGIAALHVLLCFARELSARGKSLGQRLDELAREHGLFATRQLTLSTPGAEGLAQIRTLLSRLRHEPPDAWLPSGSTREDLLLRSPASDLLIFRTPESGRICVRPSGTEPKLKFYLEATAQLTSGESLQGSRERVAQALEDLAARVASVAKASGKSLGLNLD